MSNTVYNQDLSKNVDVVRLANEQRKMAGTVALNTLPRLAASLASQEGSIKAELKFGKDVEGLYYITGRLNGELPLICQRCMQPMMLPIDQSFALSPVYSDEQASELPGRYEPVILVEDNYLSLIDTIEDELILLLPLLAKHPQGECSVNLSSLSDLEVKSEGIKDHPFAGLAALKEK